MKREYEALSRLVGRNFAVLDDGNSVYLTPTGAVRDQDGKELLPAFPGRARLYERNLKQGGGASLPDAAPYQQLVTDGDGKWGSEARLAWEETVTKNETVEFLGGEGEDIETRYMPNLYYAETAKFKIDDGQEYICEKKIDQETQEAFFGNLYLIMDSWPNTGEPFAFVFRADEGFVFGIVSAEIPFEPHSLNIEYVEKNFHKIQSTYLPEATQEQKGILSGYGVLNFVHPSKITLTIGQTTRGELENRAFPGGQTYQVYCNNAWYYVYASSVYSFSADGINHEHYYKLNAINTEEKKLCTISGTFNGGDADSTVATAEVS